MSHRKQISMTLSYVPTDDSIFDASLDEDITFDYNLPLEPLDKSKVILRELQLMMPVLQDLVRVQTEMVDLVRCHRILACALSCLRKFCRSNCLPAVKEYICASNRQFIHQIVYFKQHECYLIISDLEYFINVCREYVHSSPDSKTLNNFSELLMRIYRVALKYMFTRLQTY